MLGVMSGASAGVSEGVSAGVPGVLSGVSPTSLGVLSVSVCSSSAVGEVRKQKAVTAQTTMAAITRIGAGLR